MRRSALERMAIEKCALQLYLFLWWWFLIVAVATIASFIKWTVISVGHFNQLTFVRRYLEIERRVDRDTDKRVIARIIIR